MRDVVVILHKEAIPSALALCASLTDYEVFVFDPTLGDPATAAALHNVQLFTQITGPTYLSMDRDAHAAARALENELDHVQRAHSGIAIRGWQHLNLTYFFIAVRWYTALWESIGTRLFGCKVHVLVNDNPADYYFNSFVPAVTLLSYLQQHGIDFESHDYGSRGSTDQRIPDLTGTTQGGGPDYVLTHIPTCIYDYEYFMVELRAAGKRLINVEARLWGVPLDADVKIGLCDPAQVLTSLAPCVCQKIDAACRALSEVLPKLLASYLGLPAYRERQCRHLLERYRAQLITYFGLQRYFSDAVPQKFLLSEHDTGFHGPLISFAESRNLPVVLVPHSKIMGDLEFTYRNILTLTHPMQGTTIHDATDRAVASGTVSYPERFCGTSEIGPGLRSISLLLNSQSLNGIPFAPADAYLEGIKRILRWCQAHGILLKIRCKPGYTLFGLLRVYVGVDPDVLARCVNETMDEHASGCDLCLMYDMPTSGSLYFLRRSLPILNPVIAALTKHQLALVHPALIVPETVEASISRMDAFRSDPLSLYAFGASQFDAYVTQFRRSRALRTYL